MERSDSIYGAKRLYSGGAGGADAPPLNFKQLFHWGVVVRIFTHSHVAGTPRAWLRPGALHIRASILYVRPPQKEL